MLHSLLLTLGCDPRWQSALAAAIRPVLEPPSHANYFDSEMADPVKPELQGATIRLPEPIRGSCRWARRKRLSVEIPIGRSEREPQSESERTPIVERVGDPAEVRFREIRSGLFELRMIREVERLGPEQQGVVTA